MTDQELVGKLNHHLEEIDKMISLGDLELLKAEELNKTKFSIEDALNSYKTDFNEIESRKIEKYMPKFRFMAKAGIFLKKDQVRSELEKLSELIRELIEAKGGSEKIKPVEIPKLGLSTQSINQALKDARTLLEKEGAISAVDRVHTVLHGYLKAICDKKGISYQKDATLNHLLNLIKTNTDTFLPENEFISQILKSLANILDKLNPIRNNESLAHANEELLKPEEAMLVINTVNTLLSYLNSKVK